MVNPFQYLQEVRNEAAKVTWPSRRETVITTIMVLILVALASLFFMLSDQLWSFLIDRILSL